MRRVPQMYMSCTARWLLSAPSDDSMRREVVLARAGPVSRRHFGHPAMSSVQLRSYLRLFHSLLLFRSLAVLRLDERDDTVLPVVRPEISLQWEGDLPAGLAHSASLDRPRTPPPHTRYSRRARRTLDLARRRAIQRDLIIRSRRFRSCPYPT